MKKIFFVIAAVSTVAFYTSCNETEQKEASAGVEGNNSTTVASPGSNDDLPKSDGNDSRLNNAGEAKRPKGKMSYLLDGQPVTIDENQVQCMYIGMNSTMAQSVISGGNQLSIVHMGLPKEGDVPIKMIGPLPSVGVQVIIDGVQYNNKKAGDAKLTLTKVTPDGKNYYVAGTFSGTLTSLDGSKTVSVTEGMFESAYL